MKLQHIAAAVALAVAGTANAAVDQFTTGNGSLFLIAFDNAGGSFTTTAMFTDLGLNLQDFAGPNANANAALNTKDGVKLVWDFGNNTLTRTTASWGANGPVTVESLSGPAQNSWTAAFDKLVANSDSTSAIKWTVGAGDQTGSGANVNYLVTATSATASSSQTSSNTNSMSLVNGMFTSLQAAAAVANGSTVASATNGSYTFAAADGLSATSANGYVVATSAFGTNWQGKDTIAGSVTTDATKNLWLVNGAGVNTRIANFGGPVGTAENAAPLLNNAGGFRLDFAAKTLTWETAAVPEPETYALAIAGLVVAGALARRRRAA